ncbi:MAG: DUF1080 domain-containing protein [Anaerolineae bacterium]|nr:DUF1080 domain-containing protein [Anaerolineae bacterium]
MRTFRIVQKHQKQESGTSAACLIALLILAACAPSPTVQFRIGETLLREDFSDPAAWERYVNAEQRVAFEIVDDVFRARAWDKGISWALNETVHQDVVIEVEITQLSDYRDNAYGLMCRASPTNNGNGYYFLISGDGYATIRRGAADEITSLVSWRQASAVRQDRSINRLRIVCLGNYLALYVNGEFVADATDRRYRSGYAGLSAAVTDGEVEVWFDDLTIWQALPAD